MNNCLVQYYRCPERYVRLLPKGPLSATEGYFQFGEGAICYGQYGGAEPSPLPAGHLPDALANVAFEDGTTCLPFDPSQIVDNFGREAYVHGSSQAKPKAALSKLYYLVRPVLSVGVRKHLQRFHLRGWDKIPFPQWPVDRTVDVVVERLLQLSLKAQRRESIPFIWFWPDGAPSCAVMTHDVETTAGRDFCSTLMDIDDRFGIKAAFQVVPEERYEVSREYLDSITRRGFEVAVQDLNHDGHLYSDRQQFLSRVSKINRYGREWGAEGFRAAILYRHEEWFDDLDFSYEMSVPNVAHLDPQRGGCCTVMPYFIGKLLELPVTTTQDYPLFHILGDYSIDLWKRQTELIMEKHGLMSFIVHPDYIMSSRERRTYETLLGYLSQLRDERGVWIAKPGEVSRWWRQRASMQLVETECGWQIEGEGKKRARIAYASEENGRIKFSLRAETLVR
jgi:hypothetical protein